MQNETSFKNQFLKGDFYFMSEKQFEKLYEDYCENRSTSSGDVRRTYDEINDAFENYINAICEDEFRNAFMFG